MRTRTLIEWFEAGLRRSADAPALEVSGQVLTYSELSLAADRLAARLLAERAGPLGPVGLLATRTPGVYAGYLAILRAGGAVVPMNPAFPARRHQDIAQAAGLRAFVIDEPYAAEAGFRTPPGTTATVADAAGGAGHAAGDTGHPGDCRWPVPRPEAIAYVIFTSGSTGRPKGVPIRHSNVSPLIEYSIDRYELGPGCRVAQPSDLTYDPSVLDLFACWGAGATLVVPRSHELLTPVRFVAQREITHWQSVPSVISLADMTGRLKPGCMPSLRYSLFGGEQLTLTQARAWARAAPASVVDNIYGPSELTIFASACRLPADPENSQATSNGTVPIGEVLPHLESVIVDGELCIRGPQRFCGYADARDNAGRFLAGGPDAGRAPGAVPAADDWYRTGDLVTVEHGSLVHQGRADLQVKIRGRRVELPEIESALREIDGIREAVAMRRTDPAGGSELIAVCTGTALSHELLIAALRDRLAPHLIPEDFVWLDRLPLNANGKVDRGRLAELYSQQVT